MKVVKKCFATSLRGMITFFKKYFEFAYHDGTLNQLETKLTHKDLVVLWQRAKHKYGLPYSRVINF